MLVGPSAPPMMPMHAAPPTGTAPETVSGIFSRGGSPEAVEALLAHCFTELGAERVWCAYFDGNEKSRRCQEKCGFRFHHTERDVHWAATDEIKTEHYSVLTRAEWLARQKPED